MAAPASASLLIPPSHPLGARWHGVARKVLSFAHESRPKIGEIANGDGFVIRTDGSLTLFGVIDGVGHGHEAANATKIALEHLNSASLAKGVRPLIESLHVLLTHTRGCAVTLCISDGSTLEGAGVGNVTLRTIGTTIPAILSPGIVGHRLARLRTFEATLALGDRIALFSDGVSSHLDLARLRGVPAPRACASVMQIASHPHDDATILLADVDFAR